MCFIGYMCPHMFKADPSLPRRVTSGNISSTQLDCVFCFVVSLPRCENCVEMLFVRGSGNCVQCDTPLRKSNFRVQLFEDPTVDKEVEIRKKVLKM